MVFRIDSSKLSWEKKSNGLLTAFLTLGKADEPLEYWSFDDSGFKKRIEKITLDELTADESLSTAKGGPITIGHPKKRHFNGNAEGLMIGSAMQEVAIDNGSVVLSASINDQRADRLIKEAQEKYEGELPEISPAYHTDSITKDDGIIWQTNRRYDHFALLLPGDGRGGQKMTLRLDQKDGLTTRFNLDESDAKKYWVIGKTDEKTDEKPKVKMETILIGKRVFNLDSSAGDVVALADAVSSLDEEKDKAIIDKVSLEKELETTKKKLETAEGNVAATTTKLEESEGKVAGLETKLTESEKLRTDSKDIAGKIKDTIELLTLVGPTFRTDNKDFDVNSLIGQDLGDIKKAYLLVKNPDLNLDGKSTDYVEGLWDTLKPTGKEEFNTDSKTNLFSSVLGVQRNQPPSDGEDAAQKRRDASRSRIENNGMAYVGQTLKNE